MTEMVVRTFQQLSRVAQLEADGVLVAEWDRVPRTSRAGYLAMVAAMAQAGVDTHGRPPMWAWRGELLLMDAAMLLNPEYELSTGYATVELDVPAALVVTSDYGAWNDFLGALQDRRPARWEPAGHTARRDPSRPGGWEPEQVCLPYLRAEWVREVRPLPTTGWDEIDQYQPA